MNMTNPETNKPSFLGELCDLVNKYSEENRSNTPDFILADYLARCLSAFNIATNKRKEWYKPPEKKEVKEPNCNTCINDDCNCDCDGEYYQPKEQPKEVEENSCENCNDSYCERKGKKLDGCKYFKPKDEVKVEISEVIEK